MFNKQPFNRSSFNSASLKRNLIFSEAQAALKVYSVFDEPLLFERRRTGTASTKLKTKKIPAKREIYIQPELFSTIAVETYGQTTLGNEQYILLKNIYLRPGEEVVINTIDMTVKIRGINGMFLFSDDSIFFNLLQGINEIVYSDASMPGRKVSVDILWKDRWI